MAKSCDNDSRFQEYLDELAKSSGYEIWRNEGVTTLGLPGFPIRLHSANAGTKGAFVYVGVRTSSFEFDGERTDLHDSLSVALAAVLRIMLPWCSPRLWDQLNPATGSESELYGRFLSFEQPSESFFALSAAGLKRIKELLSAVDFFRCLGPEIFSWSPDLARDPGAKLYEWDTPTITKWMTCARLAVGGRTTSPTEHMLRRNPNWMHFRRIRPAISVFHNPTLAAALKEMARNAQPWETVLTELGEFFSAEGSENVIPIRLRRRAERILRKLPGESRNEKAVFVPLDNYCVAIGKDHLLSLNADCGASLFHQLREKLRSEHEQRVTVLFRNSRARLLSVINEDAFEEMITLLLQREPNVHWARKMGHARQPDGGRDILVEWEFPQPAACLPPGQALPVARRNVIVQCKAKKKAVGKSDVCDLRDLLEHNDATGYFLAVSSHLTVGLIDHLQALKKRGTYWTDWWTRLEIEARLERNIDIAKRYPSCVFVEET